MFKNIDNCSKRQFILAGSIYPNSVFSPSPFPILAKTFSNLQLLTSENYNKIPENLKINIVEMDAKRDISVMQELVQIISSAPSKRFVIFSNFISRCMDIHTALKEAGILSSVTISDMDLEERIEDHIEFMQRKNRVLISIDLAARGLEIEADHAILYNLPRNPSSLVSRIGRVGRGGNLGEVTLILTKSEMDIKECLKPGNTWDDVFKYYSVRTKKKSKFISVLDIDGEDTQDE